MKTKKTLTDQIILQVFLLCPNRNDSQTFKISNCKKFLLQCVCYCCNLLRWMFFVPSDNWETLFFLKACRYLDFFNRCIVVFFETNVFKKSAFCIISAITIKCSKIKLSYTILIFRLFHTFLYKWIFLKTFYKVSFYKVRTKLRNKIT